MNFNLSKFILFIITIFNLTYSISGFKSIYNNNLLGSWIIKKTNTDNTILKKNSFVNFDYDQTFSINQPIIFGINKIYKGTYNRNPINKKLNFIINDIDYCLNNFIISKDSSIIPKLEYKYFKDTNHNLHLYHEKSESYTSLNLEKINSNELNKDLLICHIMIVSNIILSCFNIYLYFNLLNLIYRNIMHS